MRSAIVLGLVAFGSLCALLRPLVLAKQGSTINLLLRTLMPLPPEVTLAPPTTVPRKKNGTKRNKGRGARAASAVNGSAVRPLRPRSHFCARMVKDGGQSCMLIRRSHCGSHAIARKKMPGPYKHCLMGARTCAVVGSSSSLLDQAEGRNIDSHDLVIRVNAAPAGTGRHAYLAPHVGTRTDVRLSNRYGILPAAERNTSYCLVLHEADLPVATPWGTSRNCWLQQKGPCKWQPPKARELKCRAHGQVGRSFKGWGDRKVILDNLHGEVAERILGQFGRTAGFVAFSYALLTCEKVSVFGFGRGCGAGVGERYYVSAGMKSSKIRKAFKVNKKHKYDKELRLMQKASQAGPKSIAPRVVRNLLRAVSVKLHTPVCRQK